MLVGASRPSSSVFPQPPGHPGDPMQHRFVTGVGCTGPQPDSLASLLSFSSVSRPGPPLRASDSKDASEHHRQTPTRVTPPQPPAAVGHLLLWAAWKTGREKDILRLLLGQRGACQFFRGCQLLPVSTREVSLIHSSEHFFPNVLQKKYFKSQVRKH